MRYGPAEPDPGAAGDNGRESPGIGVAGAGEYPPSPRTRANKTVSVEFAGLPYQARTIKTTYSATVRARNTANAVIGPRCHSATRERTVRASSDACRAVCNSISVAGGIDGACIDGMVVSPFSA